MIKAIELFKEIEYSPLTKCPYPCKFLKVLVTTESARDESVADFDYIVGILYNKDIFKMFTNFQYLKT